MAETPAPEPSHTTRGPAAPRPPRGAAQRGGWRQPHQCTPRASGDSWRTPHRVIPRPRLAPLARTKTGSPVRRAPRGSLFAISDLHVALPENRRIVEEEIWPDTGEDWLLIAGDVAEHVADIEWALSLLRERFATVVWTPGNHELWTPHQDTVGLRGEARYRHLVELCRGLGVVTPEDPYPVFSGIGGTVTVAPLFLLYDYSFRTGSAVTKEQALAAAYDAGVVCSDEFLLHPDPYPSREAWCWARIAETERRLAACDPDLPTVLVSHFPLVREPTRILRYPEFAQWCGSRLTADWHVRFRAAAVVYGHLHIPRTTWYDGVRFEEVSVGYPREWRLRPGCPTWLRRVLSGEEGTA